MHGKAFWPLAHTLKHLFQNSLFYPTTSSFPHFFLLNNLIIYSVSIIKNILIGGLVFFPIKSFKLCNLVWSDGIFIEKFVGVGLGNCLHIFDLLVHFRLCKQWLVLLVVAESSVSHNVDKDIFFELLPVLYSNTNATVEDCGLIGIHVEYRNPDGLCDFCAVVAGPSLVWSSCEPNLVVKHQMYDPPGSIVV